MERHVGLLTGLVGALVTVVAQGLTDSYAGTFLEQAAIATLVWTDALVIPLALTLLILEGDWALGRSSGAVRAAVVLVGVVVTFGWLTVAGALYDDSEKVLLGALASLVCGGAFGLGAVTKRDRAASRPWIPLALLTADGVSLAFGLLAGLA